MIPGPSPAARWQSAARAAAAVLSAATLAAHAAPPPGHPSPADAMQLMLPGAARHAALTRVGEVLDAIDANEYTYVELRENGRSLWIATARIALSRGDILRFDDGVVMTNFHSKLLQRTFPAVMFVSEVAVMPPGN